MLDGARYETDDPNLQSCLVARLRCAFLFQDPLQVVVDEGSGALGDGGSHLLQAGGHGVRCITAHGQAKAARESRLPGDARLRRHGGLLGHRRRGLWVQLEVKVGGLERAAE